MEISLIGIARRAPRLFNSPMAATRCGNPQAPAFLFKKWDSTFCAGEAVASDNRPYGQAGDQRGNPTNCGDRTAATQDRRVLAVNTPQTA
jgi:hypothetical protein